MALFLHLLMEPATMGKEYQELDSGTALCLAGHSVILDCAMDTKQFYMNSMAPEESTSIIDFGSGCFQSISQNSVTDQVCQEPQQVKTPTDAPLGTASECLSSTPRGMQKRSPQHSLRWLESSK
ncbi:hypothetical protein P7K49_021516 [Saguinus oedipus]|uniref:Uncharacterized protein n=1 Tax=Saguinus oedipus TaxID=9490 RepID=A0ABQ9USW6_SAGOE|nr:hypothetical protein P7K49_021516 [Saguinus oedipus]